MLARSNTPQNEERISYVSPIDSAVLPFELRAGPHESPALTVVSLRGREAISEPFSFEITVAASPDVDDSTIEPDLLGAPACLVMQAGASAPRFVRGVVAEVAAQSAVHGRRAVYRLRVVPALSLLKMQTASRVFQEKTVPEIVAAVLDEAGITYALRLLGKYRPRTYCVQQRETDFAFVERLLAEEGIFYTFDHGGPDAESEIVSLSDTAHFYPAIEGNPELAYRPHEGAAGMAQGEHHVQRFDLRRSLRPTSVLRRGYDFRRPALNLVADGKLEDLSGGEPKRGEIYEHHEEDEEPNIRQETVNAELEQHRAGVEVAHGSSGCRRLATGARFKLCDHDLGRLDAEYVVTSVMHEGRSPETATQGEPVYANTFECVPATVAARPPRPARSLQQVTETAIVVGPEGQEIYTDEYGRVKVQFHWDREGKRDERSSCWIRVAQAWAGSGWGFEFIPRVGMEVIVTFLGGDVDRPVITGCVPNAINRPPFPLPGSKTQSGIRTQSTPGGGGYNELSFEDASGAEQIRLRAQRDLTEVVEHDHALNVKHDQSTVIGGQEATRVAGCSTLRVGGDRQDDVMGSQSITVGGALTIKAGAGSNATTLGDVSAMVGGNQTQMVYGSSREIFAGDASTKVAGDSSLQVGRYQRVTVGNDGDQSRGELYVYGDYVLGAAGGVRISAEKEIVLQCGKSRLRLTPEAIDVLAATLTLAGSKSARLAGKGPALALGEELEVTAKKIKMYSENASMELDKDAKLDGKTVRLNCGPGAPSPGSDAAETPKTKKLAVKLTDYAYQPYKNKKYHLNVDGMRYEGETDADGAVEKDVPESAKAAQLILWTDKYPTGPRRTYDLALEALAPTSTVRGAQARLKNLGYYQGPLRDESDDATEQALLQFQSDHAEQQLDPSGKLDAATAAALMTVHGG